MKTEATSYFRNCATDGCSDPKHATRAAVLCSRHPVRLGVAAVRLPFSGASDQRTGPPCCARPRTKGKGIPAASERGNLAALPRVPDGSEGHLSLAESGPGDLASGPSHFRVAAQTEWVTSRIGVNPPSVPVGPYVVRLQRGTEFNDAPLFGVDQIHLEVEVILLRVLVIGPAWRAVVLDPPKGQARFPEVNPC